MSIKPIPFSDAMVRAILDGGKTQTRRVFKSKEENATGNCPYGKPGDCLWVREAWQALPYYDDMPPKYIPEGADIIYNANRPHAPWDSRKRNALHMPRWASRITLKIIDVRVQRIQEISEDDARAEGLAALSKDNFTTVKYGIPDMDSIPGTDDYGWPWKNWQTCPIEAFKYLWQSIHGDDPVKGWAANPLVWVIEFERIKP